MIIQAQTPMLLMVTNGMTEEEELLIKFFGDDYIRYRAKTRVGIPLIT